MPMAANRLWREAGAKTIRRWFLLCRRVFLSDVVVHQGRVSGMMGEGHGVLGSQTMCLLLYIGLPDSPCQGVIATCIQPDQICFLQIQTLPP